MKLSKKQTIAIDRLEDNTTNEILFGGGAGGGKSFIGCYWLLKNSLKYPGTRWLMGRAVLDTLKKTTLSTFWEVAAKQGLKADVHYKFNGQSNIITFINKSEILLKDLFLYPRDPNFDSLGSLEITGGFIDEANQITEKAYNITKSRIRFKLDEYGLVPKILCTCNPSKGYLYNNFYKPSIEGTISDDKFFLQALVTDNPNVSKHYYANLEKLDRQSKERLLYGNWDYDDDPLKLFDYDATVDMFTNEYVAKGGPRYIVFDPAGQGKDRTVIGIFEGLRCIKLDVEDKTDQDDLYGKIRSYQETFRVPNSHTIGDYVGIGIGIIDRLKCQTFQGGTAAIGDEKNKQLYANLRSQCFIKLSEVVNAGEMYIANQDHKELIIEELGAIKEIPSQEFKRKVISKGKEGETKESIKSLIGRSPDFADMLSMRMYFELVKPNEVHVMVF